MSSLTSPTSTTYDEQRFARSLAHPEKTVRDKTIKELKKYLSSLTEISDLEMLKLWKALFYCYWLADQSHIHTELSQIIANLMDSFTSQELIFNKYLRMFYQILLREWHHLDQYRLNKFYSLIRVMLRKSFQILYQSNWPKQQTQEFLNVLIVEILDKHPNGPRYHICDIYLPELLLATNGGDINTETFLIILQPFLTAVGLATDSTFYNRLIDRIFSDYLTIYAREHCKDVHHQHPENGHTLIQHEVINGHISTESSSSTPATCFKHVSSVQIQMVLFDIASSDPSLEPPLCTEGHRRRVYALHSQFQALTKIQFADDETVKRDIDAIPPAPSDLKKKSSSTGQKEKKSKKKKGESPPASITEATPETNDEVVSQKKKKKEKKNSTPEVEVVEVPPPAAPVAPTPPAPLPDFVASKTFSGAKSGYVFKKGPKGVGYYKDAFARGSTSAPPAKTGSKPEKKRKIEEAHETAPPPQEGKAKKMKQKEARVRFGKNQSKDYDASIQGLKTSSAPILTLQPQKSAIKDPGSSPSPRRKASSYF